MDNKDFLPKDYKMSDSAGKYMRFEQGNNKFRALTSAIVGFEYWLDKSGKLVLAGEMAGEGGKPMRVKTMSELSGKPEQYEAKEFWAFIVYNFQTKQIEILQIKQRSIMAGIQALTKNEDWGSPLDYNITVHREGSGLDTVYTVTPSPKTELDVDVSDIKNIDLTALYRGEDPFNPVARNETVNADDIPDFDEEGFEASLDE